MFSESSFVLLIPDHRAFSSGSLFRLVLGPPLTILILILHKYLTKVRILIIRVCFFQHEFSHRVINKIIVKNQFKKYRDYGSRNILHDGSLKLQTRMKTMFINPYLIVVGSASSSICFDDGGNLQLSKDLIVEVLPLYDEPLQVALVFCVPFLATFQPPLPSWLLRLVLELRLQSLLVASPALLQRVWQPIPQCVCWPPPRCSFVQVLFDV